MIIVRVLNSFLCLFGNEPKSIMNNAAKFSILKAGLYIYHHRRIKNWDAGILDPEKHFSKVLN